VAKEEKKTAWTRAERDYLDGGVAAARALLDDETVTAVFRCHCAGGLVRSSLTTNLYYARRMGQPTQSATNYTARSNIEPAQICLHANGQSAPRSGGARDVGRGAGSHTPSTASESFSIADVGLTQLVPTLMFGLTYMTKL